MSKDEHSQYHNSLYTKGERILYCGDEKWYVLVKNKPGRDDEIIGSFNNKEDASLFLGAPQLYEGLKDALREICRMCVRLNPQHENCTSCAEMERSRLPTALVEKKVEKC